MGWRQSGNVSFERVGSFGVRARGRGSLAEHEQRKWAMPMRTRALRWLPRVMLDRGSERDWLKSNSHI